MTEVDPPPPAPPPVERAQGWGKALFDGGLVSGLVAVFSAVAAVISQIGAGASQKAAGQSKALIDQADQDFRRYRSAREDQFLVYDKIDKKLDTSSPTSLVVASSYVLLIEDAKVRKSLCETIESVARAKIKSLSAKDERDSFFSALGDVSRLMRDCSFDALLQTAIDPTGQIATATAPAQGTPGTGSVTAQTVPSTTVVNKADYNPNGWDIDVFWCLRTETDGSRALGEKAATILSALKTIKTDIGTQPVGQVRLRSLTPLGERNLRIAWGNPIVGSDDEQALVKPIAAILNAQADAAPARFRTVLSTAKTSWYVSVFTCDPKGVRTNG